MQSRENLRQNFCRLSKKPSIPFHLLSVLKNNSSGKLTKDILYFNGKAPELLEYYAKPNSLFLDSRLRGNDIGIYLSQDRF